MSVPPANSDAAPSEWLNMHQALAWVRYRDPELLSYFWQGAWNAADSDHLQGLSLYGERAPLAGRAELLAALKEGALVAEGAKPGGEWEVVPSSQWTFLDVAPRDPARHAPFEQIRVGRDDLLRLFPPAKLARSLHADDVAWCRLWIGAGKGNGMDKAWPAFNAEPEHAGISRDSFRDAWREAKGIKPR